MNNTANSKSFIFNEILDIPSLHALYGEDYVYIEEVFGTVLQEYAVLAENIHSCYHSKNISGLKAAVHKIKPIFGFVGLTKVQEQCQQFEHACQTCTSVDQISDDFHSLKNKLINSITLIEEEKKKLELFNSQ